MLGTVGSDSSNGMFRVARPEISGNFHKFIPAVWGSVSRGLTHCDRVFLF